MKNQIIGTDVSLKTCKEEGYLQLKKNGKFDPKKEYEIFAYYPDYIIEEAKGKIANDTKMVNTFISLEDVLEIYNSHKSGIDSFVGMEYSTELKEYDYYSFLSLCDSVNAYCGLS